MVTQRPSELPPTALSQCGTLLALRLSNSQDQGQIRSALPDAVEGLAAVLPSLRTGEAVISGEAVVLPTRALLDLPDTEPQADDPPLAPWRAAPKAPDLAPRSPAGGALTRRSRHDRVASRHIVTDYTRGV